MKTSLFTLILLLSVSLSAQDKKPFLLGIQPGITKEKFYEENEFDINIIPVYFQIPVSKRNDIRVVSYANYHFGGESRFSDLGLFLASPVFIRKKEETNQKSSGFYIAPVLGLGRNLVGDHFTATFAMEPGYLFPTDNRFTLSLGMQLGGSYFMYDNEANGLRQHFGFKINLGFWI